MGEPRQGAHIQATKGKHSDVADKLKFIDTDRDAPTEDYSYATTVNQRVVFTFQISLCGKAFRIY